MALEEILNASYLISLLVNSVVAFIAILIANKFIAHEFSAKKSFAMAIIALFITPIAGAFIEGFIAIPYFGAFILPLIVWIVLGEIMLSAGMKTKLIVTVIAFAVYLMLSLFVTPMIWGLLPF